MLTACHDLGAAVLSKWRVTVKENTDGPNIDGLFYRSSPGVVVADADWPRDGAVVVGAEVQEHPGWIRLQNGYYLPRASEALKG